MVNDKVPKINTRIIVLPIIQLRQGTNTRSVTLTLTQELLGADDSNVITVELRHQYRHRNAPASC